MLTLPPSLPFIPLDITMLGRVIDRGLAADGRLIRFIATVSDRPGGIARLTKVCGRRGGESEKGRTEART